MFAGSRVVLRRSCRVSPAWARGARSSARDGGGASSVAAPASMATRFQDQMKIYGELSKVRLSALVVMTSSAGYLMADWGAVTMGPLVAVSAGTALAACSANTFNQVWEVSHDALMKRTAQRPLPSGRISKPHALAFGVGAGAAGTAVLATCNPLTAALGAANIGLYALVYTPMKQRSEWNTLAGALVGAIPPLMGYAAATGTIATPAAALVASTLFLWQFPHFFALAWRLRHDYARGGFAMVPVNDPTGARTADLVYKYSLYLAPLPVMAAAADVTSWMFAVEGMAINGYLIHLARGFVADRTTANSKKVFMCSLWYLPALLSLMVFHKKPTENNHEENEGLNAAAEALRGVGVKACIHEALVSSDAPEASMLPCPAVIADEAGGKVVGGVQTAVAAAEDLGVSVQ